MASSRGQLTESTQFPALDRLCYQAWMSKTQNAHLEVDFQTCGS